MRTTSLLASCLLCATAQPFAASPPPAAGSRAPMLRGHDCLEPSFARGFVSLDDRNLLVDAGRNRYRIEVSPSCWNLHTANVVGFRGDPISNRVCGAAMDAVLVRGSVPCRIEGLHLLSKEAYRQALHDREAWRRQRKAERAAAKRQR